MPRVSPRAPGRGRRRRVLLGLAMSLAAFGLPMLLRRLAAAPPLPPTGWGRGHRYVWRGEDVHFEQIGGGMPVLLVHSLGPGHDGAEWQRAAELLARRFDLLAPDLPGWGRSAGCSFAPSPELYGAFLADFLVDVVRRPAVLVAAGGSAPFAVAAAVAAGARPVRAIALVGPRGVGGAVEGQVSRRLLASGAGVGALWRLAVRLTTRRAAIQRHLEREVLAAPERADAALCDHAFRSARQPGGARALAAFLAGRLEADVSALLPRLQVPVWLGWGRQAISPPVANADLWLRQLPQAELEIFGGSGALPHLEAPIDFARRLQPFLAKT